MSAEEMLIRFRTDQLLDILDSSKYLITDLKPSDWAEMHRMMGTEDTPIPGPFTFKDTPYLIEIVNCLSQYHPARIVAIMKGGQIGMSTAVLENGIGWIISQNPGNILFLSGHQELTEEAMNGKIDKMIDSCGLRHLIKPSVFKKRNPRTGDTSRAKEFPGGQLIAGSASNHKLLRQRSIRYGFIDDFDGAKKASEQAGSTRTLIQHRFAAYYDKMKLFYISTPEIKATSNIEPVYELGDQRRWNVPCPCCGEYIVLEWNVPIEGNSGEMGGITWKLDENNKLLVESVGYTCQKCGGFFDDSRKTEINSRGEWRATAEPSEIGYYSYHISCLNAPSFMYDWTYYVRQYLEANPPGGKRKEDLHKAFVNLCLGLTYEQQGEAPEAKALQQNIRNYDIGTIPERLSVQDGNGKIAIITCACDCNGTEDDARIDYEIVAWAESGASYSIDHGSVGTFVPRESTKRIKEDREHFTYRPHYKNSVWPILEKIIGKVYMTDTANPTPEDLRRVGRPMKIVMTGIDTGHFTDYVYDFIDTKTGNPKCGVRGDKESKYRKYDADTPSFKPARERGGLYMVDVNFVKDKLSEAMKFTWNPNDGEQPAGFMNFPIPSEGKYLLSNFFSHFESEHKVQQTSKGGEVSYLWMKKTSNAQNHHFDVKIYNIAVKDIVVDMVTREFKVKKGTWADFIALMFKK